MVDGGGPLANPLQMMDVTPMPAEPYKFSYGHGVAITRQ